MASIDEVRLNSAELTRLLERVKSTSVTRGDSSECREDWSRACSDFHEQFDRLAFPGGNEGRAKAREGDAAALKTAIVYLIADPRHFRSGYEKEDIWGWLKRSKLTISQVALLERVALGYLDRRISREFWGMCKAMARIGRAGFWAQVAERARLNGTPEAFRAVFLLSYGASIHAGAWNRRLLYRSVILQKYVKKVAGTGES